MAEYLVTSVVKRYNANQDEGITHLCGADWRHTSQEVINSINAGNSYVTCLNGHGAENVAIFNGPKGDYPRGYADGVWNDNLLMAPNCGV